MSVRISELLPPPERVPVGHDGKGFDVHGLTLPQVTTLIKKYRGEFARLLVLGADNTPDYAEIVDAAPKMVCEVIAYAAKIDMEDPEEMEAVANLPAGVQLIALSTIWNLTVVDQKNLQALLQKAVGEIKNVSDKLIGSPRDTSAPSQDRKGA